jgi:hypothetical protein
VRANGWQGRKKPPRWAFKNIRKGLDPAWKTPGQDESRLPQLRHRLSGVVDTDRRLSIGQQPGNAPPHPPPADSDSDVSAIRGGNPRVGGPSYFGSPPMPQCWIT